MILGLLLLGAAQAAAPPGDSRFDIRCVIAAQSAHEQAEGEMKAATLLSVMFYFGRVDAALSGQELERQLESEGKRIEGQPLGPLLTECGKFMQQRGAALQDIASRLQALERAGDVN